MKRLAILVILSMYIAASLPLSADDGAMNNGSYGLQPLDISKSEESKIRMVKEHLSFDYCLGKDPGVKETKVVATFWFKNTDSHSAVTQVSGFPDEGLGAENEDDEDARGIEGPLKDMSTLIDGAPVSSPVQFSYVQKTKDGYWVPSNPKDGFRIGWHIIKLIIPPGGERVVERRYRTLNGNENAGIEFFNYILSTGATWEGTIGELTVDVQLEGGLKVADLIWPHFPYESETWPTMRPGASGWKILGDDRMQLVLRNLKPKDKQSLEDIQIASFEPEKFRPKRGGEKWTWGSGEHFEHSKGCEVMWVGDCSGGVFYLVVSPQIVQKVTGGLPLSKYFKADDVVEFSGTRFNPYAYRVEDPEKDWLKVLKKK